MKQSGECLPTRREFIRLLAAGSVGLAALGSDEVLSSETGFEATKAKHSFPYDRPTPRALPRQ